MARIERVGRGRVSPFERGGDDVFVIPPDMMPDGLESAMDIVVHLEGVLNIDKETGQGTVDVNRLWTSRPKVKRTDTMDEDVEVAVNAPEGMKEKRRTSYRGDALQDIAAVAASQLMSK